MNILSRLQLWRPETSDGVPQLRAAVGQNADRLKDAAIHLQGTIAERPQSTTDSPGVPGRHYYAVDIGLEFVDHGTGWAPTGIPLGGYVELATAGDLSAEIVLADGRQLSRTAYASLFTRIGTAYGSGNGASTFNIPDVRGRATIGDGTGPGLSARALGQVAGVERVTLTANQSGLRAHSHGITDPGHDHDLDSWGSEGGGSTAARYQDNLVSVGQHDFITNAQTGITINQVGAQNAIDAHDNLPPVVVVRRLIRIR